MIRLRPPWNADVVCLSCGKSWYYLHAGFAAGYHDLPRATVFPTTERWT